MPVPALPGLLIDLLIGLLGVGERTVILTPPPGCAGPSGGL